MKICTFFIVLLLLVGIVFFFQQSNIDEYGYGSNLNKISVIREEKIFSPKLSTEGDCFFFRTGYLSNFILYIIGDGPDRAKTEAKLKLYNIVDNVILVGYTDKVPDYLDDCAVYVHPAITEGFGIAVTEAMQMHCPCIVADKGALPELIADGECGFVIDAFAPEEWANKILYLFDNVEERVRMGENAYLHAKEHFSLEAFVQHHDELYKSL